MKYTRIILVLLVLLLASCSKSRGTPTTEPNAVYTSAVQTVAVQLTEKARNNPSAAVTQTNTSPATQPAISTVAVASAAPKATATISLPVTEDKVEYIGTTPGDGSIFATGQSFTVSWTVENIGKTTWTTGYQLRFFSGDRMGANLSNSYAFPNEVLPGKTVTLTADFVAPTKAGTYKSIWVLSNQEGTNFYPVYIEIKASEASATPTMTSTVVSVSTETPTTTVVP